MLASIVKHAKGPCQAYIRSCEEAGPNRTLAIMALQITLIFSNCRKASSRHEAGGVRREFVTPCRNAQIAVSHSVGRQEGLLRVRRGCRGRGPTSVQRLYGLHEGNQAVRPSIAAGHKIDFQVMGELRRERLCAIRFMSLVDSERYPLSIIELATDTPGLKPASLRAVHAPPWSNTFPQDNRNTAPYQ